MTTVQPSANTSSREVDTNLPEFSWIPFFRELTVRLRDDGWEQRQVEIIEQLKEWRQSGLDLHPYVDVMETHIDPFALYVLLVQRNAAGRSALAEVYREFFGVQAEFAIENPLLPTPNAQAMFMFAGPRDDRVVHHWLTLREATTYVETNGANRSSFEGALDASVAVSNAGPTSLTNALFFTEPTRFIPAFVIHWVIENRVRLHKRQGFGRAYLGGLQMVSETDVRPFPDLALEFQLCRYPRLKAYRDNVRIWSVPEPSRHFASPSPMSVEHRPLLSEIASDDPVSSDRPPSASFAKDGQQGDVVLARDSDGNVRYGFAASSLTYRADAMPGNPESRDIRNIYWRPTKLTAEELNVPIEDEFHEIHDGRATVLPAVMRAEGHHVPDESLPSASGGTSSGACPWSPVFLDAEANSRMLRLLRAKRNIVLQGPPGVGKTYIARKLARTLIAEVGNEDDPCDECGLSHGDAATYEDADESIRAVQFHQSYSYEDFVGGYRPGTNTADQLVFEATDGAFLRLCEDARSEPDQRFVMLIDEVNRGNLSRVFGELMMLIEPDKRNDANAVELQHRKAMKDVDPDAEFFVPDNVYIIGTMNLADRSLTGMNVAMRRRFAFFGLSPQFGNAKFANLVQSLGMPAEMQRRIIERLPALNRTIAADYALGRQYAVGHSFFVPTGGEEEHSGWEVEDWEKWYDSVIEFEVQPLLEEYWFDDPKSVEKEVGKLLRNGDETDATE